MKVDAIIRALLHIIFERAYKMILNGLKALILKYFSYECKMVQLDRFSVFLIKLFNFRSEERRVGKECS